MVRNEANDDDDDDDDDDEEDDDDDEDEDDDDDDSREIMAFSGQTLSMLIQYVFSRSTGKVSWICGLVS